MRHVPPLCIFVRTFVFSSARASYSKKRVECVCSILDKMAASKGKRSYVGHGTHHVMKCTTPSPSENTPTRNYNLRSMRAWRSLVSSYTHSLETLLHACSVNYNYAWEYFGGRRPGTFYHVMRAVTYVE